MSLYVNGREIDIHGLSGLSEARKRNGSYPPAFLRLLERSARDELEDSKCAMVEEVQELNRSLYESGNNLEPPPDLARPGEKKGRIESFLRRAQTRFIRAVCEGYVQQQQFFNSYFSRGLILSFLQLYGREESGEPGRVEGWMEGRLFRSVEWDGPTTEEASEKCRGRKVLVVGIPSLDFLEAVREKGRLVLALDFADEAAAKSQARALPAWYNARPMDLLGFLEDEVGVVVVPYPELLAGDELDRLAAWATENLEEGGRIFLALNSPPRIGLVSRESRFRPWAAAYLRALLARHNLESEKVRLGNIDFLVGLRMGEG